MNIHNLSKDDLQLLIIELNQYKNGTLATEDLSESLTEILDAVKKVTTN